MIDIVGRSLQYVPVQAVLDTRLRADPQANFVVLTNPEAKMHVSPTVISESDRSTPYYTFRKRVFFWIPSFTDHEVQDPCDRSSQLENMPLDRN